MECICKVTTLTQSIDDSAKYDWWVTTRHAESIRNIINSGLALTKNL
jgi:hypothetical protein